MTHEEKLKLSGNSIEFISYNTNTPSTTLIIKGSASASANLIEWRDSSATTIAYLDSSGYFHCNTNTNQYFTKWDYK